MHIATLLPPGEFFEKGSAGAVSLYVRDFHANSDHRHSVLGAPVASPLTTGFYGISLKKFFWQKRNRTFAARALKILKTIHPDQVDVHNRIELFDAICRSYPTNIFFHNDPLTMRGSKSPTQRKAILNKAHRIFCVSEYIRTRFLEGIEDPQGKVIVMPNGIAIDDVDCGKKEKIILFVGRLIEEKGAHIFVEAAMKAKEHLPDWTFMMIGANRPGQKQAMTDFEKKIITRVEQMGERFSLNFFMPYEDVMAVFRRSMIVVVPSLWEEPFGRTALEAIATKNALITTGRGGLKDICNGVAEIDPQMDADSLTKSLISLANDLNRMKGYQVQGYQRAKDRFDIKFLSKKLDQCRQ